MAGIVLAVGVLNLGFAERITMSQGLGWDGQTYRTMTVQFQDLLAERKLDAYFLGRILPSAVVHVGLRAARMDLTTPNVILGFQWLSALLLAGMAFLWGLTADWLNVSTRGKWFGLAASSCPTPC